MCLWGCGFGWACCRWCPGVFFLSGRPVGLARVPGKGLAVGVFDVPAVCDVGGLVEVVEDLLGGGAGRLFCVVGVEGVWRDVRVVSGITGDLDGVELRFLDVELRAARWSVVRRCLLGSQGSAAGADCGGVSGVAGPGAAVSAGGGLWLGRDSGPRAG